ncbi:MAG: alpha/beta fold hydrolase [Gammaproteobacteria bacterium]|nr:MAG: alpha/beta hydrolase [Gammaproteobacteria bacterium]
MKKVIKWAGLSLLALLICIIYIGTYFDIPRERLEAKYAIGASQFLTLDDGSRIHYRDEGNQQGQVIVLVHGFNGSLLNFERLVPYLSKEYRLVSLDLPAFGLTGAIPSGDYSTERFMKTINQLVDSLDIDKFSIAGNSMGGGVSWRYTLEHPEQINSLILIASSSVRVEGEEESEPDEDESSPLAWRLLFSNFTRKILLVFTPKLFAEQGLKTSVYDQDLATKEWANQFHELVLLEGSREAIISMFSGERYGNETPEIFKQISAPTLVIHGEEDNLIELDSVRHFEQNIPEVTIKIYSEIGHLPMYEDPLRTANDIKNFLQNSYQ